MSTLSLSRKDASIAARQLMQEAKASGKRLSYTQALKEVALQRGFKNVHEMTASFGAPKKAEAIDLTPFLRPISQYELLRLLPRSEAALMEISRRLPATVCDRHSAHAAFKIINCFHQIGMSVEPAMHTIDFERHCARTVLDNLEAKTGSRELHESPAYAAYRHRHDFLAASMPYEYSDDEVHEIFDLTLEHPFWLREDWQYLVDNDDTSRGYWSYVANQMSTTEDLVSHSDVDIDLAGDGDNTTIRYMYRDGANYKTYNRVVVRGRLDRFEIARLFYVMGSDGFIPGQIGLKDLQDDFEGIDSHWDPDLDHIWHDICAISYTNAAPTVKVSAVELVKSFWRIRWNTDYTPPFYETMKARYEASLKIAEDDQES